LWTYTVPFDHGYPVSLLYGMTMFHGGGFHRGRLRQGASVRSASVASVASAHSVIPRSHGILGIMTIVVFGSLNMDLVARTMRLPLAGETVAGHGFHIEPGGKGANQAVACARLGVPTKIVGRVGADEFGITLRKTLQQEGIDGQYVEVVEAAPTGVAVIAIDDRAENTIIVVAGANGTVNEQDIERLEQALEDATILLLQLEVPLPMVIAAAETARKRNIMVLIDPAPARHLPERVFELADIVTPNETEAAMLVGFSLDTAADIELAATILRDRGARAVAIKLGARGVYTLNDEGGQFHTPFIVEAVDSVGAGDAFNGGLAVALAEGLPFHQAVRWGLATGALAVTRSGAQTAMPNRAEVEALLNTL
jgi:ribokinase